MEELDEPGQAAPFDMAQGAPRETFEQMQQRRRDSGSSNTTPGGTPIKPSTPDSFFEKEEVPPRAARGQQTEQQRKSGDATRMLQGINKDMTGKRTIDIPDDHGRNTKYPLDKEELDSWYSGLGKEWKQKANELQEHYQKKGYKGFFDPAIKGKDLLLRNYLFDQTSGQWRREIDPNKKSRGAPSAPAGPGSPDSPEKFFGKEKRSELKSDAPALAMLGGNYMGGDDA